MTRLLLLAPLLLGAQDAPAPEPMARAILTVQQGGTRGADGMWRGGTYKQVDSFEVPAGHGPRDNLIAFEGPGWESDKVAYRLYLDERNVPDIYGKRLPGAILHRIGQGKDDYHAMADWGQDIFQVDQSLGMGGIGVLRGGKATQLGPSTISVMTLSQHDMGAVRVENRGFRGDGGPADLVAGYGIGAGSRVSVVKAGVTGHAPQMVAGMRHHDDVERIDSPAGGRWRYVATYGVQSLAKDRLGIALFYQTAQVSGIGDDGQTLYVRFASAEHFEYAFAAAWEQEPGAPVGTEAFRHWLDEVDAKLERGEHP